MRADGSIVTLVSTGLPLGLMDDRIPYADVRHTLDAGDTVVLYSDGVTDAQNTDGEDTAKAAFTICCGRWSGIARRDCRRGPGVR